MFLPVLLVRDFGFAGWLVFAVPNFVGAGALGWVLSRPTLARQIAADHAIACQGFSAVTIAFQCFFLAWVVQGLIGWAGVVAGLAVMLLVWQFTRNGRRELLLAAIVLGISVAVICVCVGRSGVLTRILPAGIRQGSNLLFLSPVIVFGFLLCPYLDLTFLRARAMTSPNSGIAAFTLAFGIFFPLLIVFSLWYAPLLASEQFAEVPSFLATMLAVHMLVEAGFTMGIHTRPLAAKDASVLVRWSAVGLCVVSILLPIFASRGVSPIAAAVRNEFVYRLFMSFYGLVSPAYVWICLIRTRGRPGQVRLAALAIAVLAAAPFYWLGFMDGKMIWLVPGLAIVLASRLIPFLMGER